MEKPKFQIIKLEVKTPGEVVQIDTVTKIEHEEVNGLFLTLSDDYAAMTGEIELSIDQEEILPEKFESFLVTVHPRIMLSIRDTMLIFNEKAKGSKIKGSFTDKSHVMTKFPYYVRIYLLTKD